MFGLLLCALLVSVLQFQSGGPSWNPWSVFGGPATCITALLSHLCSRSGKAGFTQGNIPVEGGDSQMWCVHCPLDPSVPFLAPLPYFLLPASLLLLLWSACLANLVWVVLSLDFLPLTQYIFRLFCLKWLCDCVVSCIFLSVGFCSTGPRREMATIRCIPKIYHCPCAWKILSKWALKTEVQCGVEEWA